MEDIYVIICEPHEIEGYAKTKDEAKKVCEHHNRNKRPLYDTWHYVQVPRIWNGEAGD